jgi:hypothetical protein
MPTRAPAVPSSNSPRVLGTSRGDGATDRSRGSRGDGGNPSAKHRRHDTITTYAFAREKMHQRIPLPSPLIEHVDKTPPVQMIVRPRIQTR